jgi:hypothetical protein
VISSQYIKPVLFRTTCARQNHVVVLKDYSVWSHTREPASFARIFKLLPCKWGNDGRSMRPLRSYVRISAISAILAILAISAILAILAN